MATSVASPPNATDTGWASHGADVVFTLLRQRPECAHDAWKQGFELVALCLPSPSRKGQSLDEIRRQIEALDKVGRTTGSTDPAAVIGAGNNDAFLHGDPDLLQSELAISHGE